MMGSARDQSAAVVLLALLIAGAVADAIHPAEPLPVHHARSRKLQGVSIIPTGITANIAGTSIPLSLPNLLGGTGTPSQDSPRKFYRVSCDKPKPTFVVVPGRHQRSFVTLQSLSVPYLVHAVGQTVQQC